MMATVAGVGGTLLPERYVALHLTRDAGARDSEGVPHPTGARLSAWWPTVEATCGPTSPLRVLFDELAMPLFAMLGFTAHDAVFEGTTCYARLQTAGGRAVALVLTSWAGRPSSRWADVSRHAHQIGAGWGFVLAPPFLSVVPTHGFATRRAIDFELPVATRPTPVRYLLAVARAACFDPVQPGGAGSRLDQVLAHAASFQDGVRVDLQQGVESSLRALEPVVARVNGPVDAIGRPGRTGPGSVAFDEALTIVYRILFLLFAESRGMVPTTAPIYRDGYAVSRFCAEAAAGRATGLWDGLAATSRLSRLGCRSGGLRFIPFNGALFARASAPALERRRRRSGRRTGHERDEAVRRCLVALGSRPGPVGLEQINYRDLGVEQLGAVYERVLDLDPPAAPPRLGPSDIRRSRHSRVRRQSGTFYTPQPLAEFVVRRTLAPLVEHAAPDAILELRILDPAMGSGAFLVAACRYLASAYEDALVAEGRMGPGDADEDTRAGMRRLVAERCLAGVDRNSTAVQLARLSLWLTTLARGRPLGFLDHRLRCGNSLVGAWPADLWRVTRRKAGPSRALPLFDLDRLDSALHAVRPLQALLDRPDDSVLDVRTKAAAWKQLRSPSSPLHRWRMAADIWCARWFASPRCEPPGDNETRALIDAVTRSDGTLRAAHLTRRLAEAAALARSHGFFHWPLEFPDVFDRTSDAAPAHPGFDAVLGNPPWEMLRRDEGDTERPSRSLLQYVRQSGQYPSCRSGHLNLYQAFVDRSLALVRPGGRLGLVLPWGVATDDGAAPLRARLLTDTAVDLWAGIDNAQQLFPIHRGLRFAAVSATVGTPTRQMRAVFGVRSSEQLDALPARGSEGTHTIVLTPRTLALAGGASLRVPDIRRPRDLDLLLAFSNRFPRLGATNGWGLAFGRELNATDVRPYLLAPDSAGVPVVEGKHLAPFTVDLTTTGRVAPRTLASMIDVRRVGQPRLAYRDVSGVGNKLTLIAAVIPSDVVTTHTVYCSRTRLESRHRHFLCAILNSFVMNALVRCLMGGHVTTVLAADLPVPLWRGDRLDLRIAGLARCLSTAAPAPAAGACLQALVAQRFRLTLEELTHVLDGFPLVPAAHRSDVVEHFRRNGR